MFPDNAEAWAGWVNSADIYPLTFGQGGALSFKASAEIPTTIRFRFEYQPYPNVDPAYDTAEILISGSSLTEYTVNIPSQGENTFSSMLMYLAERGRRNHQ